MTPCGLEAGDANGLRSGCNTDPILTPYIPQPPSPPLLVSPSLSNTSVPLVPRSPRLLDNFLRALTRTWAPGGGLAHYRTEHPRWAGQVPALFPIPLLHTPGSSRAEGTWATEVTKMDSLLEEDQSAWFLKSQNREFVLSRSLLTSLHPSQCKANTPCPAHLSWPLLLIYTKVCLWETYMDVNF